MIYAEPLQAILTKRQFLLAILGANSIMEPVKITPAQARIAHHVAMGHTNTEIARLTGLAEQTVKNHLNAIYGQGHVVNRNELIQAYRTGRLGVR